MSNKQVLLYGKVEVVNKKSHLDLSVRAGENYDFARNVNSVPLMTAEFQVASAEFPIVFAGAEDKLIPVAVMGLRAQENAFLDTAGKLQSQYVPAFLRRYPFIFSTSEDGKTYTLCVDEGFMGCNREGRGERLFDSEGEQTTYLKGILDFLQHYQVHHARTLAIVEKLQALKLLEPMGAQIKPLNGQLVTLSGFHTVNREKLKALPADELKTLIDSDVLELIYLHLHSLRNFESLGNLQVASASDDTAAPASELAETAPSDTALAEH